MADKLLLESGGDYLSLDTGTDDLLLEATQVVSDTLNITELLTFVNVKEESVSDTLSFSETLAELRVVEDTLSLSELLSFNTVSNISVIDTLVLTEPLIGNLVATRSLSDSIQFSENAFGIVLGEKTYVMLQAPYGLIEKTLILPNPLYDDTESLVHSVNLKRSMNGGTYTYVKSSDNRVLKYTFTLPREKGLELEYFCRSYQSVPIKLTNWKGEIWYVHIMTNPLDFVETTRYFPTSDRTDINLEFEGNRVY